MRTLLRALAAFWLVALMNAQSAQAISLSLVPSSPAVSSGDLVAVDVIISGLGNGVPPSVGAYDLDVGFDPGIFSPTTVAFGPFLGDPLLFEALTDFNFATPGVVDFAEVSLLSSAELDALQPSTFLLATLSFVAIADGSSPFGFVGEIRVDDAFGNKLPEPGTLALLAIGTGLLVLGRRRMSAIRGDRGQLNV